MNSNLFNVDLWTALCQTTSRRNQIRLVHLNYEKARLLDVIFVRKMFHYEGWRLKIWRLLRGVEQLVGYSLYGKWLCPATNKVANDFFDVATNSHTDIVFTIVNKKILARLSAHAGFIKFLPGRRAEFRILLEKT